MIHYLNNNSFYQPRFLNEFGGALISRCNESKSCRHVIWCFVWASSLFMLYIYKHKTYIRSNEPKDDSIIKVFSHNLHVHVFKH